MRFGESKILYSKVNNIKLMGTHGECVVCAERRDMKWRMEKVS